jgi:hypothetical protein
MKRSRTVCNENFKKEKSEALNDTSKGKSSYSNMCESLNSIENTLKRGKRGAAVVASTKMVKSPSVIQKERSKIKKLKGGDLDEECESTKQKVNVFHFILFRYSKK